MGSRIIMTTRINAIAEKCRTDYDAILYDIKGLSDCAAAALSERIISEYHDLPLHLKACLLLCSIYPGRYSFERDSLVRKWIAEGFVHVEEAAEGCFDELVNRRLIEPASDSKYDVHTSSEKWYEIHTITLGFLRSKLQEDNIVTCSSHGSGISVRIRRLSFQDQPGPIDFTGMDLSHTRSLYVFDAANAIPIFERFERLRVLDFEDTKDLVYNHVVVICGLLWLRYLGLKGATISKIPPEIGRLQHLETLDVRDTEVRELPWEAGQISESLRVLAGGKDSREVVRLPEGVCHDLKKGGIQEPWLAKDCREVLSIVVFDRFGMSTVSPHVGVIKVTGRHMHIPQSIKNEQFSVLPSLDIRLCTLDSEGDDLKFLREMPNLQTLVVRLEVLPREPIPISGEGFQKLESFCVDSRVPRVTFEPGAMRKLKLLAFKFYAGPASEDPVGITHLRSLEKVVFRCSPWYNSGSPGILTTLDVVRREAGEHPNRITLCINDKEEIFPENDGAHICGLESSVAGSRSGTEADKLDDDRNSLAGNGNNEETFQSYNFATCSRTREIEEIE